MLPYFTQEATAGAIPIWLVTADTFAAWRKRQPRRTRDWLNRTGFRAERGRHAVIPAPSESEAPLDGVVVCAGTPAEPWDMAALPSALRRGTYRIDVDVDAATATALCTGWGLGTYAFTRYKPRAAKSYATLEVPPACDVGQARRTIAATFFATAGAFAGLSLYGYTTQRDLSGMGSFLIMGVIGLIIASVINMFLQSTMMHFIISVIGVLVFVGLTAYDTQKIKEMYFELDSSEVSGKKAIMGALRLYLDFINLFLMLLRLFGERR